MSTANFYPAIESCEVCGSNTLLEVLNLGLHPLCDDLIPVGEKSKCLKYPIEIMYCSDCGTAHQKYQVKKSTLFSQNYHYRSRFTADVLNGMANLVESAEKILNSLENRVVLDIGCNDASLLDIFSAKKATTIGIEPTGAYTDAQGRQHLIINDFFSDTVARKIINMHPNIDVITFTNVFAHIEDLPALLKALQIVMNDDTILIIENHYLGAVLEQNQFDTFYHEHPRTYSLKSFLYIAQTLNREVVALDFPQRYGGNIRVTIGKKGMATPQVFSKIKIAIEREAVFLKKFADMRKFISLWKKEKKSILQEMVKKYGKLSAKAFPGRAAILVALLELSDKEIDCVYEKPGSLKIGNYLPGTRIPIHSDDELIPHLINTEVILNLAWHIPKEIETYLRKHGYKGELINIV